MDLQMSMMITDNTASPAECNILPTCAHIYRAGTEEQCELSWPQRPHVLQCLSLTLLPADDAIGTAKGIHVI